MAKISPTRMNLLARKSQLGLAREGVELLKHKREVLMSEFMNLVKPLKEKQSHLHIELVQAFHCLNTARAIDGRGSLESAVLLREHNATADIGIEKKWGLELPKIESIEGIGLQFREPHSHSISLRIFETRDRFDSILQQILELAPLEVSLKRLGREIQKTTRRINALEIMLMPGLRNEIRFIRNTLEEREREDNFRLRRIKNKKGK
ncbi:MAG: V-type ATP synthase subunit D [Candidatus Latescibacteria bacterium]|nr:V-type ATP synthase subunit D [Candidatus Latescibacterota bacterium]